MRREFSGKVKLAVWERCGGKCETCKQKILGRAEYDHVIPDALGGKPTEDNCECLCSKCHRLKTFTADVPRIAKTKRTRNKTAGVKRSKNPMPGSRASNFRKRMDGTVEKR